MAASRSDPPRRGRKRRRKWLPEHDVAAGSPAPPPGAGAPNGGSRPLPPTKRYPWHDDPAYQAYQPPPGNQPGYRAAPTQGYPPPQYHEPPTQPVQPPGGQQPGQQQPGQRQPGQRRPKKLTVARVAAMRSRELTNQGIAAFRRAASADGADRSGLTALTYATMMTYAVDAAIAVALANTLFFSAATAESRGRVALYLLITVAPFALVAPVIGPLLDRLQRGRRAALASTFAGRAALALVMAFNFDSWVLYPAALGALVLSKSFVVLKAAVTPRVLPPGITLVTTNSRLTVFGLVAGGVFGAIAAGVAWASGSVGALIFTAIVAGVGTWACLRIPRWVEVTEGEVPAALRATGATGPRPPMGRRVVVALWANGSIKVMTGFLLLFMAFVIKAQTEQSPVQQLLLLGIIGAAAGVGSFAGNLIGARQRFDHSNGFVLACVAAASAAAALTAILPSILTAAIATLVAATASAFAKVCLDSVIQRDLPEEARSSAFGRSETILQLTWVFGGALGLLLPTTYWIGFTVVAGVVALGGVQTWMVSRGRSLLPRVRSRAARRDPVGA